MQKHVNSRRLQLLTDLQKLQDGKVSLKHLVCVFKHSLKKESGQDSLRGSIHLSAHLRWSKIKHSRPSQNPIRQL